MKRLLISTLLLTAAITIQAQQHGTGLVLDDDIADKIPQKTRLLTRSYTTLPKSWSLTQYCPAVGDQTIYQTCVGWASAYAARTIAEAVRQGWTNPTTITNEAFAPLFTYGLIKQDDTKNCNRGTNIEKAMQTMKNIGAVKKRSRDTQCVETVNKSLYTEAAKYKIDDYFLLFGPKHDYETAVNTTKKAIAENCPVVIGFWTFSSFFKHDYECWNGNADKATGSHAMCVVGYDDNKFGGAFLVMNSWGTGWGKGGYAWITYKDYAEHTHDALELYLKPKAKTTTKPTTPPKPTTTPTQTTVTQNRFAGNLTLQLSTGEKLKATLGTAPNGLRRYRITEPLTSGTRYRIYISNNQPGYVYVFSSDLQNNAYINFPADSKTSAALTYKTNAIALPGEKTWLELDDTRGTDYLCVLFSTKEVELQSLLDYLKTGKGTFYEKVQTGFSKYLAPQTDIKFNSNSISFTATSTKDVVPLLIEFSHR